MDETRPLSFGTLLRRARRTTGLTQAELSERAGVSVRTVSDLERDVAHTPHRDTVRLLADALGLAGEERAAFIAAARGPAVAFAEPSPHRAGLAPPDVVVATPRTPAVPALRAVPLMEHGVNDRDASVVATRFPALPADTSAHRRPHNLPLQATPFIGREREIADLRQRLLRPEVRLLVLTGVGGTGKTRLALQVAAALLDQDVAEADAFADGVFAVFLAPLSTPTLVASTVARALGLAEAGGQTPEESLVTFLRDKQMLLVLDNFEHVVEAAPLIPSVLATCAGVKVLVTSRVVLRLSGEHDVAVPPLGLPDPRHGEPVHLLAQSEAVRLFVARAQAARADFAVTVETAPVIAEICRHLDGLPLAIELAAARVRMLSPQALLARLSHRLTLLTGGARDAPARQQTLRQTLDWSYGLLSAEEQALFRQLAVFAGGWTLHAAEAILGPRTRLDVFEGLASLVDQSLVRREEDEGGAPRFSLLETVREYAWDQLAALAAAEVADLRRAHAAHYLALAEEADATDGYITRWTWLFEEPEEPSGMRWRKGLRSDVDNLRAALRWAQDSGDVEVGVRLVAALSWFWYLEGQWTEGRAWVEVFVALHRASGARWPRVRLPTWPMIFAGFARMQGDFPWAISLLEDVIALLRRQGDHGDVAALLACLALIHDKPEESEPLYEESLALCRALKDHVGSLVVLDKLGEMALIRGDEAHARSLFAAARAAAEATADTHILFSALLDQAQIADRHDSLRSVRSGADELLTLSHTSGHPLDVFAALRLRAEVAREEGDYDLALSLLEKQVGLDLIADEHYQFVWLIDTGQVARAMGNMEVALSRLHEGLIIAVKRHAVYDCSIALVNLALIAWERGDLDQAVTLGAEAVALCRTIRGGERDALPGLLASLGLIARTRGELQEAETALIEGLCIARERALWRQAPDCLDGLAAVAVARSQHERAVRLFAAASAARATLGGVVAPAQRAFYARELAAARAALGEAAFRRAQAAGEALPPDQAVATVLAEVGP